MKNLTSGRRRKPPRIAYAVCPKCYCMLPPNAQDIKEHEGWHERLVVALRSLML